MNKHLTASVGMIVIAFAIGIITSPIIQVLQQAEASAAGRLIKVPLRDAIPAISGDNVYVVWWANKTADNNNEVMFRASTDGGQTFGDKINLSNTTEVDSVETQLAAEADSVVVTWWETNQTAEEPVLRISTDNGATFGPLLKLAANGTIGGEGG